MMISRKAHGLVCFPLGVVDGIAGVAVANESHHGEVIRGSTVSGFRPVSVCVRLGGVCAAKDFFLIATLYLYRIFLSRIRA